MIGAPPRNAFTVAGNAPAAVLAVALAWSPRRCPPAAARSSGTRSGRCACPCGARRRAGRGPSARRRRRTPRAWSRNGPSCRATGLDASTSGSTSFERGAQVHERGVRAPHERREPLDRLRQRQLLVAQRAGGAVEVADQRREVVAALGERGDQLGAVHQEALEVGLILGELVEQAAGGGQRRVQVLEGLVGAARRGRGTGAPGPGRSPAAPCACRGRAC